MADTGVLSRATRAEDLERLAATSAAKPLDVLVVGGGVTGAGAAYDAALRGLDVGLLEASDWASGTSSRSSKLMHGGLRYLEMLDFKLVAEALRERDLMIRHTAPHLVHPISFVFPFEKPFIDRAFIGSGVLLYDAMAVRPGVKRAVPMHRHHTRGTLRKRFPALDLDVITGALEYYDAQVDDARFVEVLVRSARARGAATANYVKVVDYLHEGDRVVGARVRDEESGQEFDVYARCTILAGGVWTEQQQDLAQADTGLKVLASKGVHITVAKDRIAADPDVGVITKTEKSVLFIIPWDTYWIIGTTDTPWNEAVDSPVATSDDIDYVLEHANAVLSDNLTRDDVIGVYAGLRPLLQPVGKDAGASTKVSREHTVMEVEPGLTAIAGGKYTTYRVMAEDVVDFAIRDHYRDRTCLTESVPLLGAQGYGELKGRADDIARTYGFSAERIQRLLRRYGSLLPDLLALIDEDSSLGQPLAGAERYLRAEAVYAARYEGVVHLDDLLERRMRLNYEVADRGVGVADEVATLVAEDLGWDEQRVSEEVKAFKRHVAAQRAAEGTHDDASAVAELVAASHTES
ncbi:glycerol-3-phosphate dehydrogenase/oxidase [Devriesea agamarum]|uniref:glycerol-3-phosphate dehydrogenase/oxidase n=1 Tax=Devriesea agamarum TaxID=472569 RepID=UPI00071D337E|nr:glycerol-3-phosphate dehydrogenase/oxidase [Devriesea agamarum]